MRTLGIFALILTLSACGPFNNPVAVKRAACNTLKSKIVFNAATSDTRRANIDRSEEPLQEKTYDVNNCAAEPF